MPAQGPYNRLPRPPKDDDKRGWSIWFDMVHRMLSASAAVMWEIIDKGGSRLSDIVSRPHSDLQNIEAADVTSSDTTFNRHISDAMAKGWTDDIDALQAAHTDTLDPTGWIDPTAITVTYNDASDTITLTGTLEYYWRGEKHSLVSPWTSTAHSATTGVSYFLSSTDGINFTWSTTPWTFSDLMVAFIQHGVTDLFGIREVHSTMGWHSHEEFHRQIGTYRQSGGDLSGYVLNSTTAADRRPLVAATLVHDEDIESTVLALVSESYTQVSLTGSGTTTFTKAAADIVPLSGSRPYYNSFSGTWGQTLIPNNDYMNVWLVVVPTTADTDSQEYRYLWIQGQSSGGLLSQLALFPQDLNLGSLTALATEFCFITRVTLRYTGGDWEISRVTDLTGNRVLTVGSPAGVFLSTVATDATLTGDGTTGNPLSVVGSVGGGGGNVDGGNASSTFALTIADGGGA